MPMISSWISEGRLRNVSAFRNLSTADTGQLNLSVRLRRKANNIMNLNFKERKALMTSVHLGSLVSRILIDPLAHIINKQNGDFCSHDRQT